MWAAISQSVVNLFSCWSSSMFAKRVNTENLDGCNTLFHHTCHKILRTICFHMPWIDHVREILVMKYFVLICYYSTQCDTKMADCTRYTCVDKALLLGVVIDALRNNRASKVIDTVHDTENLTFFEEFRGCSARNDVDFPHGCRGTSTRADADFPCGRAWIFRADEHESSWNSWKFLPLHFASDLQKFLDRKNFEMYGISITTATSELSYSALR